MVTFDRDSQTVSVPVIGGRNITAAVEDFRLEISKNEIYLLI